VALVTGAGRRLGRTIALALARQGADVVVHYGSSRDGADETVGEIERLGRTGWSMGADLSDPNAIGGLFDRIEAEVGGLDVLVNNAARFDSTPFDDVEPEDWGRSLAVNLRAPFFASQRAARLMRGRSESWTGAIVNITDVSGFRPWLGFAVHGISKAGLAFMTEAAARELGPAVRVNAVMPGPILPAPGEDPESEEWKRRGSRLPLGRTGDPEDVADAVLYLVRAEYVTGVVLPVDGGERLVGQQGR
jgi:NAD(P)-dependent dehydrogenase (short-subunit alcohol dehydrogenase family)